MYIVKSVIILLILDVIWIMIQKHRYEKLVNFVQKSPMSVNIFGSIFAYILMVVGLIVFVLPNVQKSKNKLMASLKYGGLYGLTVYGIFNATNIAIFKNYSVSTGIIDTIWGSTLFALTPFLASLL